MASIALAAGLAAAGSIGGSLIGASASKSAANQQVQEQQQALALQQQQYEQSQANLAPFVSGGQSSFGQLLDLLKNGTFGPGSIPAFTPPTGVTMLNDPGFQFIRDQGQQGILRGSTAAGGSISGGTLKALDEFNQNAAGTAYQSVYNNALNAYSANLGAQAQQFNQLLAPIQIGESAAAGAGNLGVQSTAQIGNTLTNIGTANAAGTIGTANALTSGIGGAINSATLPLYLQSLYQQQPYTPSYGGGQNLPPNLGNGTAATPLPYIPVEGGPG